MTSTYPGRKTIYLPGSFQGRFACRLALYWTFYHVAMWHSMFFMDYVTSQAVFATPGPPISFGKHYLLFARQNWTLVMWAFVIGPVFIWKFIHLSHRVAGPLLRLERTLLRMAEGEPVQELKFREGDLASGLEKAFNAYLSSLPVPRAPVVLAVEPPIPFSPLAESREAEALDLLRHLHDDISTNLQPIHVAD